MPLMSTPHYKASAARRDDQRAGEQVMPYISLNVPRLVSLVESMSWWPTMMSCIAVQKVLMFIKKLRNIQEKW